MFESPAAPPNLLDSLKVHLAFRYFGDNQSGWFMIKDREHTFHFVNQRFADMVGRARSDIIGLSDADLGLPSKLLYGDPDAGLPGVRVRDEECMASGKPMRTIDGAVDLGEGGFDSTLTIRTPLLDNDGKVIGLVIQAIDHSDVRRLEKEIQSANETATYLDSTLVTLDRVLADLLSYRDRTQLLQKITDTVVSHTAAEGAYIATRHEFNDCMLLIAASGHHTKAVMGRTYRPGEGLIGQSWAKDDIVYTEDAVRSGAKDTYNEQMELCAVPIHDGCQVVAVISAILPYKISQSLKDDIPNLRRLADLAGIALANSRLLSASENALQQSRKLAELSRQLSVANSTDDVCALVCNATTEALNLGLAAIVLFDEQGEVNKTIARSEHSPDSPLDEKDIPGIGGIAKLCLEMHEAVQLNAAQTARLVDSPGIYQDIGFDSRDNQKTYAVSLPLPGKESIIGALVAVNAIDRQPIDSSVVNTLTTITSQLTSTLERMRLSDALHHQAFHDHLTGLPNRYSFEISLRSILDRGETGAILFIDLDGFKDVNDTLGHAVGDQLLQLVADRLRSHLKTDDILARMGGDEFAVILRSSSGIDGTTTAGLDLLELLSTSFQVGKVRIKIAASAGLSRFPEDGHSVDILLRNADVAMYQAKRAGKGRLLSFDEEIAQLLLQRAKLQADLLLALEQDQFELHYQPQVCCVDGVVLGVEALLRWTHPEHGSVSPGKFIPAAEHAGIINDLGTWVVRQAIQQIAQWQDTPLSNVRVSVNIAASQFQEEYFTELVLDTLDKHNAPANRLELEVTESVVMNDVDAVVKRLEALRDSGIRIAIDDFGTGYSSLSYLQNLPLDVLKIDRAFISPLQDTSADKSLANTIAFMASSLGLETVAEGVETIEQHEAVLSMGVNMIQGYFYSRPVPATDLKQVVEEINDKAAARQKAA